MSEERSEQEPFEPGRLEAMLMGMGTAGELVALLARGGRWWMLPLVAVLLLLGAVLVVLQMLEYVAPFVYIAI